MKTICPECDNPAKACAEFKCLDCGVNTLHNDEYYMVEDDIWDGVHPKRTGMLCIGCLEKRMGRKLTSTDFTDAPINYYGRFSQSARLYDRLTSTD